MGFLHALVDLIGLLIVVGVVSVLLYIPFASVLGAILDLNTWDNPIAMVLDVIVSTCLINSYSEGALLADLKIVSKSILIMGAVILVIAVIAAIGGADKNRDGK